MVAWRCSCKSPRTANDYSDRRAPGQMKVEPIWSRAAPPAGALPPVTRRVARPVVASGVGGVAAAGIQCTDCLCGLVVCALTGCTVVHLGRLRLSRGWLVAMSVKALAIPYGYRCLGEVFNVFILRPRRHHAVRCSPVGTVSLSGVWGAGAPRRFRRGDGPVR